MESLSVLVLTRNEEDRLPACLAGVAFADEIVVVDSGSDDGTREVAAAAGARVLEHSFVDYADQKNWGLAKLAHRWVLIVDADERVPPALRDEIRGLLAAADRLDGYWIRRDSTFLGRRIRGCGWQDDRVLRLFDRDRGRYAPRHVHEEVAVDGKVGELRARLEHDPCRDLSEWIRKTDGYARRGAEELRRRGKRFRLVDLWLRAPIRFGKQWLLRAGWRDGVPGFVLCAVSAWGVMMKYAHLRELERKGDS